MIIYSVVQVICMRLIRVITFGRWGIKMIKAYLLDKWYIINENSFLLSYFWFVNSISYPSFLCSSLSSLLLKPNNDFVAAGFCGVLVTTHCQKAWILAHTQKHTHTQALHNFHFNFQHFMFISLKGHFLYFP